VARRISNTIGIDDEPFARSHRGDVGIVGAVFTRTRFDGLVTGRVRRDGRNSAEQIATMIERSPFDAHVQAVFLQGIALAGFNVVDIHALAERLGRAVIVVARNEPNMPSIRRALQRKVPGGARKLALIERAGAMKPVAGVWVQCAGISIERAETCIRELSPHGRLPEPIRVAHLIAGGLKDGVSRGRA
jgi:hypothetical protein